LEYLFMGMGSILAETDSQVNRELAEGAGMVQPGRARAQNDAVCALAGGLCGRPGVLLISGTGSACLGRNGQGHLWRAGGWGYRLHDAGSAYQLGLEALIAATRDADGRDAPTPLTAFVLKFLGIAEVEEIYRRVHERSLERSEIASFAPQVAAFAGSGDPVSLSILDRNAAGLVEMVVTVCNRLNLEGPELALTGGLISSASLFRELFMRKLRASLPGLHLAADPLPPVLGAVLLAAENLPEFQREPFTLRLRQSSAAIQDLHA
jgi:N-acetylglucosamine kinase-like BadF-type ATPase